MRLFLRLLANIYYWIGIRLIFLFFYLLAWLIVPFGGRGTDFYGRAAKLVLSVFLFLAGTRLKLTGAEKAAGRKVIYLVNRPCGHAPLYLIAALQGRFSMVVVNSLFRVPIVGRVIRSLGYLPLPRPAADSRGALAFAAGLTRTLLAGMPVVVYYEPLSGKSLRNKQKLDDFVTLAGQIGAAIVPISVTTSGQGNKPNREIFLLGAVSLAVGPPWDPGAAGVPDRIREYFSPIMDASFLGLGPI